MFRNILYNFWDLNLIYFVFFYYIFEWPTFFIIPLIAIIAWAPFFVGTIIKKKFFPETIEKLNQAKSLELKSEPIKEEESTV